MGNHGFLIHNIAAIWLAAISASSASAAVGGVEDTRAAPARSLFSILAGISFSQYLQAFALVVLGLLLRRAVMYILDRYREMEKPAALRLDERLVKTATHPLGFAVAVLLVLGAEKVLSLPDGLDRFAANLLISILIVDAAWLLFNFADALVGYLERFTERPDARLDKQLLPIIRKSVKIFVVILAALQVIDQMGGDVKSLLAGLGLGGLAFALAARESIANIFGSIVILADRPFRVGDWIEAQGHNIEGTVEEVGFRSTRIRTFSKSLVTVPNSVVANWAINNLSAMPKRRVKVTIGVSHEATPRQVEGAVEGIREILRNHPMVDQQEESLVHFVDFGEASLQILVCYFAKTTLWAEYLKVREEINFAVMRLFDKLGLKIALPAPVLYRQPTTPPAR